MKITSMLGDGSMPVPPRCWQCPLLALLRHHETIRHVRSSGPKRSSAVIVGGPSLTQSGDGVVRKPREKEYPGCSIDLQRERFDNRRPEINVACQGPLEFFGV
jgi:hypothetical protein